MRIRAWAAWPLAACVSGALGQTYDFALTQASSSFAATVSSSTRFAGTLIGSALTTPGGTVTRNGLFGGSGNQYVGITVRGTAGGSPSTRPTGTLTLELDTGALTVRAGALALDLLGGSAPALATSSFLTFGNFRTFSPSSTYIGVTNAEFPLGDATITVLTLTQQGAAATGTLTPSGPGAYAFTLTGVATVAAHIEASSGPIDPAPQDVAYVLTGTIAVAPDGETATLAGATAITVNDSDPGPTPIPENTPADIPTLLPPGQTAHVLLNGNVTDTVVSIASTASIAASGTRRACAADFNGDTAADDFDSFDFLNAFFAGDAAADFNGDTSTDDFDLFDFLNAFFAGC
ncbi:MAG: hypothetical protein JNM07_12390 [Phycisphaerae bacterium]|nr:hypothetical protein [Phycisphaerae bacterium]